MARRRAIRAPSALGMRLVVVACGLVVATGCLTTSSHVPGQGAAGPVAQISAPDSGPTQAVPQWYTRVDATVDPEYAKRRELGDIEVPLAVPVTREGAHGYLLKTDTFAGVAVGFAGSTSQQSKALSALLQEPDAVGAFEDLVRRGSLPGQLYGLCGLYLKDRAKLANLAAPYRRDDRTVRTMFGCIGRRVPVHELLPQIEGGWLPKSFDREAKNPFVGQ